MKIYEKLFNVKKAWITLQRNTKAFNYKYATLDQIQNKLWDILEKEKLVIIHYIKDNKLITEIRDIESEEFVSSEIELTTTKAQDKGSEITYFRRYNLLSLLDLEVEDDDWKQAQDSKPIENTDDLPWIAQENIDKLTDLIADWKYFTLADIRKKYKVSKVNAEKLKSIWIS
jgi:hypothetical protein